MNQIISIVLMLVVVVFTACQQVPTTPQRIGTEQHRPQFHFTPSQQWMNDPNGMVYYDGEYHLFYQHYPDSNVWGAMHWGHAVSRDLVNWAHLPIALYPDSLGMIFSGSAVIDWKNTTGFQTGEHPPMVAIYTYHLTEGEKAGRNDFQTQGIAYSNDKGRTWKKYEENPVIANTENIRDFRDPKVFWHKRTKRWVMILAMGDRVRIYNSKNLKTWTATSEFGPNIGSEGKPWECPDLFQLPIEGTNANRWVMLVSLGRGGYNGGSATQYFIGNFDGKTFRMDRSLKGVYGKVSAYVPNGQVFADFENGYVGWKIEGNAFGKRPVKGQNSIKGYTGNRLASSLVEGEKNTGTLTSQVFVIGTDFINFQIGGGSHKGKTCINLLIDGAVVRTKTGVNDGTLRWETWNVRVLKGQKATLQIVDTHTKKNGYIHVDQIVFANEAAKPAYQKTLWVDYGRDNYAGVTWSDIPKKDGRRLLMGWMSNWQYATVVPTDVWRSAMTLPRVLTLKNTDVGLRLASSVVQETQKLRNKGEYTLETQDLEGTLDLTAQLGFSPKIMEVRLTVEMKKGVDFGIILSNTKGEKYKVGYNGKVYYSDRTQAGKVAFSDAFAATIHTAPRMVHDKTIQLHLFVDVASAELYADGGLTLLTDIFFPNEDFNQIALYAENGKVRIKEAIFNELNSIY